jgi:hypothetical protein
MTKEEGMWRKNIGGPRKHMGLKLENFSWVATKETWGTYPEPYKLSWLHSQCLMLLSS